MLFPITTLTLLACIVVAYRHERRSPLGLALLAWAASLVLASPLFFSYAVHYLATADALVAACLFATTVAYRLARRAPKAAPSDYDRRSREVAIAKIMGIAGILGCLLLLVDARANGLQLSVSYLLDNLSRIRASNFDSLADSANRGPIGTLGGLAAPCGVICILAAAMLRQRADGTLRMLAIGNFALVAAVSLGVFAGRATISNVTILVVVSLFLTRPRALVIKPKTALVAVAVMCGVWLLGTSWLATREQRLTTTAILQKTQRAELQPWLETIARKSDNVGLAMVSVGYFASPMPTLHFYLSTPELPGPFYGGYSYPMPARIAGTLNGTWTRTSWYDTRQAIFTPMASQGYFPNVWTTWHRDLLVDFGYAGAILFCALFGAFMAWARNRFQQTGAMHYHFFEVLACFTLGFGAFTSFLFESFVAYPFALTIAIMFVVRADLKYVPARQASEGTTASAHRRGANT